MKYNLKEGEQIKENNKLAGPMAQGVSDPKTILFRSFFELC